MKKWLELKNNIALAVQSRDTTPVQITRILWNYSVSTSRYTYIVAIENSWKLASSLVGVAAFNLKKERKKHLSNLHSTYMVRIYFVAEASVNGSHWPLGIVIVSRPQVPTCASHSRCLSVSSNWWYSFAFCHCYWKKNCSNGFFEMIPLHNALNSRETINNLLVNGETHKNGSHWVVGILSQRCFLLIRWSNECSAITLSSPHPLLLPTELNHHQHHYSWFRVANGHGSQRLHLSGMRSMIWNDCR